MRWGSKNRQHYSCEKDLRPKVELVQHFFNRRT